MGPNEKIRGFGVLTLISELVLGEISDAQQWPIITVTDWEGKAGQTSLRWCSLGHLHFEILWRALLSSALLLWIREQLRPDWSMDSGQWAVDRAERVVEVRLCRHTEEKFRALVWSQWWSSSGRIHSMFCKEWIQDAALFSVALLQKVGKHLKSRWRVLARRIEW